MATYVYFFHIHFLAWCVTELNVRHVMKSRTGFQHELMFTPTDV